MAEAENRVPLWDKREAITALLPYAVWEERDGRPEMFNTILHAAGASREQEFMWNEVIKFISTLFSEASPRAAILASPHLPWSLLTDRQDLVQQWITMASVAPHTEELAQGAVDTLLQIASNRDLLQHIIPEAWSWLTLRPSLPPFRRVRGFGKYRIVKAIQALKDIEVLKSYFLLVWSEWDTLCYDGLDEMRTSILEDFGGIGMRQHRVDLIQRLDHVLGQLDRGLENFTQHQPYLDENDVQERKNDYRTLRETLLGANTEAISRTPRLTAPALHVLTPTLDAHRIPRGVHVCTPSPVSIVARLECSIPHFILCSYPYFGIISSSRYFAASSCSSCHLLAVSHHWGGLRSNLFQCSPLAFSSHPRRITMFCILSSYSLTTPTGCRFICNS